MNIRKLIGLTCTLLLVSCVSYGSDENRENVKTISKEFKVAQFSGITSYSIIDIVYCEGEPSVKVEATDKMMSLVEVEVKNGMLVLKIRNNRWPGTRLNGRITAYVSSPEISSVRIFGTGDFHVSGRMPETKRLDVDIKGTGNAAFPDVTADKSNFSINGTGSVSIKTLAGSSFMAEVKGTGDFEIEKVNADKVSVNVLGTGEIEVGSVSCNELTTSVTGTGDIDISGIMAKTVFAGLSGTGDITLSGECDLFTYSKHGFGNLSHSKLKAASVNGDKLP